MTDFEVYKHVERYEFHFFKDGEFFKVLANVKKMLNSDRFSIEYSHTYIPDENAGVYYSDSYVHARSEKEAFAKIEMFVRDMMRSYKIVPWNDDA